MIPAKDASEPKTLCPVQELAEAVDLIVKPRPRKALELAQEGAFDGHYQVVRAIP
jgi:hypothetical protein